LIGNEGGWCLDAKDVHPGHPSSVLAADLDGNGLDEVIANFPGYGVYAYHDNSASWAPLHNFDATILAAGDLDGTGRDEVIVDFGAHSHGFSPAEMNLPTRANQQRAARENGRQPRPRPPATLPLGGDSIH
jgi:hypothetical protein